ncbi:MAG: AI-2E family transporter [Clostridia bacterium]|nr:AI-2E family transporter [Clostridia bacterium]
MSHRNTAAERLLWLLHLMLAAGICLLFYRVLFRPLLPLAAAFLLSGLIAKPTRLLAERTRLPQGLWALLLTLLAVALLCGVGWLLVRFAADQGALLLRKLPALLADLQKSLFALQQRFSAYFPADQPVPKVFSPEDWLSAVELPRVDLSALTDSLGKAASSLPDLLITAVFTLAATVLLTGYRGEVLAFLRRQLPPRMLQAVRRLRGYLKEALWGWCKAQGLLASVTFGLLLAGFFFLRVEGGFLLALLIAALDALPLLGAGMVLIPWALAELLLSNPGRAAGLALLFALIVAVRNGLEPHVVGRQIGLHPLVSLISFYLGWRLAGLAGMLLAPILMLILVKLQEWGYSRFWR